jgi:peptide/nickel transport system permease protein
MGAKKKEPMAAMIRRRLLLAVPLLFIITLLNFALINLAPGDPLVMILGSETGYLSAEQMHDLRHSLGLDQPWPVRYVLWLRGIVTGQWGRSFMSFQPVTTLIANALGPTVLLMTTAMALALMIGVSVGILSALKQYSLFDYTMTVLAFAGVSIPNFFLGLVGLYVFYSLLGWLPASGMQTAATEMTIQDVAYHLIMPALVLAASHLATYVRYARTAMLDVLREEYITTARAKGLRESAVIARHAIRNALLPMVTILGLQLPSLFGGSVFIETIFSWPGIGSLAVKATFNRDYPVVMGILLISSLLVLAANLLTDIAYHWVDPRIREK